MSKLRTNSIENSQASPTTLTIGTTSNHDVVIQRNSSTVLTLGNGTIATPNSLTLSGTGSLVQSSGNPMLFTVSNSEQMRIDTTGNIGIGVISPSWKLHVSSSGIGNAVCIDSYANDGSLPGPLTRKARGTISSPSAVVQTDILAGFIGKGYATTGFGAANTVAVTGRAAETFTDTSQATYITLDTTPVGATTRLERMRIDSAGNVGIGKTPTAWNTSGNLDVAGTIVMGSAFSYRNKIINGEFAVWQRGTTIVQTSGGYCADMLVLEIRNGTSTTSTKVTTDLPSGFSSAARIYATNGTDDGFHINIPIELPAMGVYGIFTPGTVLTFSYYAKSAYTGRTIQPTMRLASSSITGGADNSNFYTSPTIDTLTTSWQRFTHTITVPTWTAAMGSLSNVTVAVIRMIHGADNTPQDTYITGVQLEVGSVATPFEFRPYGMELMLCQRYLYASTNVRGTGVVTTAANVPNCLFVMPMPMRVTPGITGTASFIVLDTNSYYTTYTTTGVGSQTGNHSVSCSLSGGSWTGGSSNVPIRMETPAASVSFSGVFSAEL